MHQGREFIPFVGLGQAYTIARKLQEKGLIEPHIEATNPLGRSRVDVWYALSQEGSLIVKQLFRK